MEVYLGGGKIFEDADFSGRKNITTAGFSWYLIKLPHNFQNKTIYFRIYSNQRNIGLSSPVSLGAANDFTRKIIWDDIDNILAGALIIFTGLNTLFILIFFQRNRLFLGMTLFFLSSGIFICINTSFIYLLIKNAKLILYLNVFSMFTITSLYIFIAELIDITHKTLLLWPWRIHLSYIILSVILIQFPGITVLDIIDPFFILFTGTVIYSFIVVFNIRSDIKWNAVLYILLIGTTIYLICAFIEIGIYYFQNLHYSWRSDFYVYHWGVLAFACSLIAVLIYRYVDTIREKDLVQRKMLQNQQIALEAVIKEKEVQKMFLRQLILTQENERQRIAGELHDSIGQDLLIAKNKLILDLNNNYEDNIKDVLQALSHSIDDISKISHNLHPSELDYLGITLAIEAMTVRAAEASGINFSFEMESIDKHIKKEDRINLFRIIQEAVNNIIKHSKATEAAIKSCVTDDHLSIEICDNGIGITTTPNDNSRPHFGLLSMNDRADLLNGKLDILSGSAGTKVTLVINLVQDIS